MTDYACTFPGCDVFPYSDVAELIAHLSTHTTTPTPTPSVAASVAAPSVAAESGWRGRPAERRTPVNYRGADRRPLTPTPTPTPTPTVVECRWTKDGDDWVIRGPIATLRDATTVTVVKKSGESKSVDVDPESFRADRKPWDTTEMAVVRPAPKAAANAPLGFHAFDGSVYKVVESKTGNLYAKVLVPSGTDKRGSWEYAAGAVRNLSADTKMSADDAAAFGHEHGICAICGALLTNPESIARGIGPICAGRI
jgi:hypothetical protein